ncbi:MAG: hypothetical protein ACREAY_06945 [Nitrososphaera sp.]|uniref:hypothetical protein n=1 Tax=Nitrososphaera sp. TaxID=1971748 RepID=UPI003D701281
MLFRKDATIRERATVALANLQRNAYAMSMLRGRLESRINFILSGAGKGGEYQEMARVLELVKNSELILNELSGKVESARFLEEFITIIDSAASSVSGIKGDVENLVPIAENALLEMHDAIANISGGLYAEPGHAEAQQILDEAAAAPAVEAPRREQAAPAITPAQAPREEERQAELA